MESARPDEERAAAPQDPQQGIPPVAEEVISPAGATWAYDPTVFDDTGGGGFVDPESWDPNMPGGLDPGIIDQIQDVIDNVDPGGFDPGGLDPGWNPWDPGDLDPGGDPYPWGGSDFPQEPWEDPGIIPQEPWEEISEDLRMIGGEEETSGIEDVFEDIF